MAVHEFRIRENGTASCPPAFLAGVQGGTAHFIDLGQSFSEISYTRAEAPAVYGIVEEASGASLTLWLDFG